MMGKLQRLFELKFGSDVDSYAAKHCCRSNVLHCIRPVFAKPLITALVHGSVEGMQKPQVDSLLHS